MELAQLRVRKSSYFKDGDLTVGWLVELRGVTDPKWAVLSFRNSCGEVSTWYDTEDEARSKIDEIRDAINTHYARLPNSADTAQKEE